MRVASEQLGEEDPVDFAIFAEELAGIRVTWDEAASQQVLPITAEPLVSDDTIQSGAKAFVELNCYKCHGKDGRGNKAFNVGKDEWGHTAFAADLTSGTLHGGRRPVDIYRRIYSGINGTPMPGFKDPDAAKEETELQRSATIWHLTHFVSAIIEAKPLPMDVIEEAAKIQAEKEAAAAKAANP
jgi:mono/diheme cytochrome c family protein